MRGDGGAGEFQNAFALSDGGGANEPRAARCFWRLKKNFLDAIGHNKDFFRGGSELEFHQVFFPAGVGNEPIGQLVRFPLEGGGETARREVFRTPAEHPPGQSLDGGLRTLRGEQVGDEHLDFFLVGKVNLIGGHPAKIMDEVAALVFIPPAQRFDRDANLRERRHRLLDLDGLAAMRQRERQRAVHQDFHASNVPSAGLPGNAIPPGLPVADELALAAQMCIVSIQMERGELRP